MSEQTRVAHPEDGLLSEDIEGFHFLAELALDMRSSWNHAADQLWLKLDPVLWERRLILLFPTKGSNKCRRLSLGKHEGASEP